MPGPAGRWFARRAAAVLPVSALLAAVWPLPQAARQDQTALNNEGSLLLQAGEAAAALDRFPQAAALGPDDPAIAFNVGLALFRLGRLEDALEPLGRAREHAASMPNARFLRGVVFYRLDRLRECVRELELLRGRTQFDEQTLYMLVESYRRLQAGEESKRAFLDLTARYPDSAFVHKLMGAAYDAQQQWDLAAAEFQAALRANPKMPEAAFGVGYIRFKQRRYDAARPWLEQELALDPCHARAHYYLGRAAEAGKRFAEARRRFEQAAACRPQYADPYLGLGMLDYAAQQYESAVEHLRKALALDPQLREARYRLARALRRLGRGDEARGELAKVEDIHENEHARHERAIAGPAAVERENK